MSFTAGHVLVLDDDELVGATIGMVAEDAGYTVTTTSHFDAFWTALREDDPSHVVVDLNMPNTDGMEVLRRLAVHGYPGGVIISSGLERRVLEAARQSASEHGLNLAGALPKPFEASTLRALLAMPAEGGVATPRRGHVGPTAGALRDALASDRLSVVYQPKVACATGAIVGFEALARWHDPELGTVTPDVFVPLAEREGLIRPLTDSVFGAALSWLGRCDPDGHAHLALNLSARSLSDFEIVERHERLCERHGIAPHRTILELTETAEPDDEVRALAVLTRFRIKGVGLSIDDFGTGHSTLVQLARRPVSELKIDRQFVTHAATSRESQTIIRATVSLAHGLGVTVTAEGVEDADALAFLVDVGCDFAQGYVIGRPMPEDDVVAWWAERAGHDASPRGA